MGSKRPKLHHEHHGLIFFDFASFCFWNWHLKFLNKENISNTLLLSDLMSPFLSQSACVTHFFLQQLIRWRLRNLAIDTQGDRTIVYLKCHRTQTGFPRAVSEMHFSLANEFWKSTAGPRDILLVKWLQEMKSHKYWKFVLIWSKISTVLLSAQLILSGF